MMRTLIGLFLTLLVFLMTADVCQAKMYKYRAGFQVGLGNYTTSQPPNFSFDKNYGFHIGGGNGSRILTFSVIKQINYTDSSSTGKFGFFADKSDAQFEISSLRFGFDLLFRLKKESKFQPTFGLGLGYAIWKYKDPIADTVIKTIDQKGGLVELAAAEMYISPSLGLDINLSSRTILGLSGSYDFLTGVGTSFADSVNNSRTQNGLMARISLSFLFGQPERRSPGTPYWTSDDSWAKSDSTARPEASERDSDGDGIYDKFDDCPNTPTGARVNRQGCPSDADGDGIPDGIDDCPKTPQSAWGMVDIFGCPIDTDYDGIPDYFDRCNDGPIGAITDDFGCPIDSDSDGIYDGLDDCPGTKAGIDVDMRGCIDVSFTIGVTKLNIDYEPGSFEVDERSKNRLLPLIEKLLILTNINIQIYGYTDNVGPSEANQIVSQRRANRLRDWLASQGIEIERMKAVGRGETRFVASNQTAKGRAENRRIELIFTTD